MDFFRNFSPKKKSASHNLDELETEIGRFYGLTGTSLLKAGYMIELDSIPKNGIISAMSGVSTESGGQTLSLTGASFSIEDNTFDELTWNFDDDKVNVELDANQEIEVNESCFHSAERLLFEGFQNLVLGTTKDD